jgi:hypothetical protein
MPDVQIGGSVHHVSNNPFAQPTNPFGPVPPAGAHSSGSLSATAGLQAHHQSSGAHGMPPRQHVNFGGGFNMPPPPPPGASGGGNPPLGPDADTRALIHEQRQSTANNVALQRASAEAANETSKENFLRDLAETQAKARKAASEATKNLY